MSITFWRTAGLLVISNTFMTFAWYAHLRNLNDRKWYIAASSTCGSLCGSIFSGQHCAFSAQLFFMFRSHGAS